MAEDDDEVAAWLILVRREHATGERSRAEHVEVVRRHAPADHSLRAARVGQIEVRELLGGEPFERGDAGVRVDVVADRHARRQALERFADDEEALRLEERNRPQHHGVHGAENGGGPADPERQREDRDRRKAGIFQKLTNGEADVLPELVQILRALHVAVPSCSEASQGGADARAIAQATFGLAARRVDGQAARDELARAHLDVKGKLFVDFVVDVRTPEDAIEEPHVASSTREIAAEKRAHSAVWAAS